jgi:hypothetical protein
MYSTRAPIDRSERHAARRAADALFAPRSDRPSAKDVGGDESQRGMIANLPDGVNKDASIDASVSQPDAANPALTQPA